jgi:hypothetical protein
MYIDYCQGIPIYVGIGNRIRLKIKYRNIKHRRYCQKYGITRFVILETDDYAHLQIQEILAIKHYHTFFDINPVGCNLTKGGEGLSNACQQVRSRISKGRTGIKLSEKTKEKLRIHFTGVFHSKETINKMALDRGSKPMKVFKNGAYVGTWISKSRCARDLKISRTAIRRYFKSQQYQVKGYTFEI